MIRKALGRTDILQAAANKQQFDSGTSIVKADSDKAYFVTSILGSTVTVKDAGGNTVGVVTGDISFNFPFLRLDAGFDISAAGTVYITFFEM
jgi:hypothetical protein